jgi:two-component system sensor histidine kinase UhpB
LYLIAVANHHPNLFSLSMRTNQPIRGFFICCILSLLLIVSNIPCCVAQKNYRHGDSVLVFALLTRAEKFIDDSKFDSAYRACELALNMSRELKSPWAEAHTRLRMADIHYCKAEFNAMVPHDSIALKIGLQLNDSFITAMAWYRSGQTAMHRDRFTEAHDCFNKALRIRFEKDQSQHTATIYNDIGYLYGLEGIPDKQVEWYLKAIRVYEKVDEPWGLAQSINNLSAVYVEINKRPEALMYSKKAIAMREKLNDIDGLAISYGNLSQIYLGMDSVEQAVKSQNMSLQYAQKSGIKIRLAHSYMSMALIMNRQKNNHSALEYEQKAIALLEELGETQMASRRYISVAILSKALGDSVGSLQYFQKAYDMAVAANNKYNLRDIFFHKTIMYKDGKDYYNAYENLKKYYAYRDSIVNEKTAAQIAEVQTQYETEKKDKEITQLSADQKIRLLEIEKQKAIIAGNLLEAEKKQNEIALLSKNKELQDTKIKQQNEELEKQILQAKNKEQELLLARQEKALNQQELSKQKQFRNFMIGGIIVFLLLGGILFNRYQLKKKLEQQQQLLQIRNNIARDLHDEIGSTLTSIHILSQVSQTNLQKDSHKTSTLLQKITEQSKQMQQSMSDIVWTIKSDNDKIENMMVRMREYLSHTIGAKDIAIRFQADEEVLGQTLSMQQRKDVFLIFKEAVNNAAKYAQCSTLEVNINRRNGHVALEVKDNGLGFDCQSITSGNGLKNMKGRAHDLNGELFIDSQHQKGTTIRLEIPAT